LGCSPHEPATHVAGAVQSALVVQVFTQAPPVQRPGAQLVVAEGTQVPPPLHIPAGVRVDVVGQLAAVHCVPAAHREQLPFEHRPVVPQVVCAWTAHLPCGSTPPATLVQLPVVPARLQAWHALLHELLQQTPWAQKPLAHSIPAEQAPPFGFRPQLLIIPFIPQMFGAMQSALVVQAAKHLVALQW
jgi:hypothetical protein